MLQIQLPTKPKVISKDGNKTVFEIAPLYPGYGVTIGNALRRVLISSLDGAAVTSVKIKGVDHEFTTIPGVLEDVIDVIMSLKRVRFMVFTDEPVVITLHAKGLGPVTASSIKATSDIKVVNPDQHVATITDAKIDLEMEMTVERGIGYVPVEQRQKEKLSVGKIAIDGIFTPIKGVNFVVENIRVGQRTDYNRILLDIETDGSITPEQTIEKACQILIEQFSIIKGMTESEEAAQTLAIEEEAKLDLESGDMDDKTEAKKKKKASK